MNPIQMQETAEFALVSGLLTDLVCSVLQINVGKIHLALHLYSDWLLDADRPSIL